jgi:hypothetical protein
MPLRTPDGVVPSLSPCFSKSNSTESTKIRLSVKCLVLNQVRLQKQHADDASFFSTSFLTLSLPENDTETTTNERDCQAPVHGVSILEVLLQPVTIRGNCCFWTKSSSRDCRLLKLAMKTCLSGHAAHKPYLPSANAFRDCLSLFREQCQFQSYTAKPPRPELARAVLD